MKELDVNTALRQNLQKMSSDVLLQRVVDYLVSSGLDPSKMDSVATRSAEFSVCDNDLLVTNFGYGNVIYSIHDQVVRQVAYTASSHDDAFEAKFMYEYLHEDRQSFKFTKGLKVGAKAVFNAKLPLVCASYEKVSAEVSFSAEQTVTTAERSRWNFSETVTVRPNNDVKVTGFVRIAKLDAPFTCNVKVLDGDAFVELNLKTGTCWQLVMPLIAIMSDDERTFGLSGNLESSKAVGTYVKVVSTDLPVSSALTQA